MEPASPDRIQKAAAQLLNIRPSYGPLINFYQDVFIAQEKSRQSVNLDPISIDADLLSMKLKNKMPLVDPSQFSIDTSQAALLFRFLLDLADSQAPKLAKSAAILKDKIGTVNLEKLFSAALNSSIAVLDDIAESLSFPVHDLIFFAFNAISPSLQAGATQLNSYLKEAPEYNTGYCPVCGNTPDFSFFDGEGKKNLVCSFCSHTWRTRRMGCVFCESNDADLQNYFFSDEEKEYRVYLCDECRRYLKTVDLRQLHRTFVPKLEQIATLHLDMIAQEKGYSSSGMKPGVSNS